MSNSEIGFLNIVWNADHGNFSVNSRQRRSCCSFFPGFVAECFHHAGEQTIAVHVNRPGIGSMHTAVRYITGFYGVVSEMVTVDIWPVSSKARSTWFKDTFFRAYSVHSLHKTLVDGNTNPFAVLDM